MTAKYKTGAEVLCAEHGDWLKDQRIGLVAHRASVSAEGLPSAELIQAVPGAGLSALMGPEHGFYSSGGAGDPIADGVHETYRVPVYSLYGEHHKPTPEMLEDLDVLVFDLQDLGFRCYTYVSTLHGVLEAAEEAGLPVIIADRPIPLPDTVDGPMLAPGFESFVGRIPVPLAYGMTPGETACWMVDRLELDVELRIALMQDYERRPVHELETGPWILPSPAIRNPRCAYAYLATVFTEALPQFDCARTTDRAFQVLTSTALEPDRLPAMLNERELPGVLFSTYAEADHNGIDLEITDAAAFLPVVTSVHILSALQEIYGAALWEVSGVRPDFFDLLYGTDQVRLALQRNAPAEDIVASWVDDLAVFRAEREAYLLY